MNEDQIKQQLIKETKGSVFASLSFYLSAIGDRFDNIALQSGNAAKAAEATYELIVSSSPGGASLQQYRLEEMQMEAVKPNVAASASDAGRSVQQASLGILQYAALLPLLLSKSLRSRVITFFTELLEAFGFGKDSELRKKVTTAVNLVKTALAVAFGYSALKKVADAINATIRLAEAIADSMGLMDIFEKKRAAEDADMKRSAKAIRREKARIRLEKRKLRKANPIQKAWILTKRILPKVAGKIVGAIPIVGTFAMIGLALKDIFDEVTSFFNDNEEGPQTKEDVEAEREVLEAERPAPSITYNPEEQSEAETRRLMRTPEELKELNTTEKPGLIDQATDALKSLGKKLGIGGSDKPEDTPKVAPEDMPPSAPSPIIGASAEQVTTPSIGKKIEVASANVVGAKKQAAATNNIIVDNSVTNLIVA